MFTLLLSLLDENDRNEVLKIYEKYHDDLIRIAKYKLKNYGRRNYTYEAEDAVENVFLKIVKYFDKVNTDVPDRKMKSYLLTILSNEIYDLLKEYNDTYYVDTDVDTITNDDNFAEQIFECGDYNGVVSSIKKMDIKYSSLIFMHYGEGKSVEKISKLLSIPVKTVYTRIARAKEILLEFLNKGGGKNV